MAELLGEFGVWVLKVYNMHVRVLVFLFILVSVEWVMAQELEKFYFNDEDNFIESALGCHYYSVSRQMEHRTETDTLLTIYCKTEKVRTIEVINKSGQRNGTFVQFDENGNKLLNGEFTQGSPILIQQWYTDGTKKSVERFQGEKKFIDQYWDSLGILLVKDGNGYCECSLSNYYSLGIFQKGKVKNSLPDSVWTGYRKDGSLYYTEEYDIGQFINGTSYDADGKQYDYNVLEEPPEPTGGMASFYQHVAKVLRYPTPARRKGIEGKVFIEFIVEMDGSISGVRAVKGIGGGCDEEAVSSVQSSPKWKPGIQRGQKVRSRYVVPITFKLG